MSVYVYASVCGFVCIALLLPFVLGFCLFFFFFLKKFFFLIIIFYFNNFILFYFTLFYFILLYLLSSSLPPSLSPSLFFFLSFLPFILSPVEDRVLVLQPGVRAVPLRWESQVQDTGPQETSQLHGISMVKISQKSPSQRQDPAPLNDQQATVQDTLCQTTSKTGTQPHP